MAQMKDQVLGSVSGALKDLVFRERFGKNYAALRPSQYHASEDPASIARRSKFKMAVEFSKAVNKITALKPFWKPLTPTGLSQFNYIVKTNYFKVSAAAPGSSALLAPDDGFPFVANNVDPAAGQFELVINAIGTGSVIDPVTEVNIRAYSVLFMSDPNLSDIKPYIFISLASDIKPLTITDPITFISPLNTSQTAIYNQYNNHKIYFCLVTLNAEGNVVHYSVTQNG